MVPRFERSVAEYCTAGYGVATNRDWFQKYNTDWRHMALKNEFTETVHRHKPKILKAA